MKKLLAVFCGILVLSISGVVSAGQETGFYLGGSAGSAKLAIDEGDFDFDDDDLGWKVYGGYNFGVIPALDLAIEGSYVDFGEASSIQILNQNVGVTAFDIFGLASFDIGPIGVFGKIGYFWWDSEVGSIHDILDDSGNDVAAGVGVKFAIGSLALRAEYERFAADLGDIDYISTGFTWTF